MHTDRQTDIHTHTQHITQTDRQTDRHKDNISLALANRTSHTVLQPPAHRWTDGRMSDIHTDRLGVPTVVLKPHSLTFPVNHTKFPDLYRHTFQYRTHTMTCNTSTNYALQCMLLCSREQRTEINGQSMSMMWPTLGLRTAKEQNRTDIIPARWC